MADINLKSGEIVKIEAEIAELECILNETGSKRINLVVDVYVWQKVCKLASVLKRKPEEAAIFLLNKVQPTHKPKED